MSAQVFDFTTRRVARLTPEQLDTEGAHSERVRQLRKELGQAVRNAGSGKVGVEPIWNRLRVQFSFDRPEDIEPCDLPATIAFVAMLKKQIDEYHSFTYLLHDTFKNGLLRGDIWTPGIKKALKRKVGERPDWYALKAQADELIALSKGNPTP